MPITIAITGASGFLGTALAASLRTSGHTLHLLGRKPPPSPLPSNGPHTRWFAWDPMAGSPPPESLEGCNAVVHLAGEPVSQRWTQAAKQRIELSRSGGTRRLVEALSRLRLPPRVLICASAVGYYGDAADSILTETSSAGRDFLARVCQSWEEEAAQAAVLGLRVVFARFGVVLGAEGGALASLLPLFRLGLAGPLASGRQWMPWVHRDDATGVLGHILETGSLHGPVNVTAPEPVRNREFTSVLARLLNRPALLPVPRVALRVMLGEMADVVLSSQRVLPAMALANGYQFRYPHLPEALRQILVQSNTERHRIPR